MPMRTLVIAMTAHGEGGVDACICLAQEHENVYVEPSWINLLSLEKMVAKLGADKLMFSSDMPQNTPAELAIFHAVFTEEEDLAKVLGGTALRVFDIP